MGNIHEEMARRSAQPVQQPLDPEAQTKRIAELNDLARKGIGVHGRWVWTPGIRALSDVDKADIQRKIETFTAFTEGNDPYGERDFGSFDQSGQTINWKIDYYDKSLEYGSEDPSDPGQTTRVLTICLAEEY
jgi:hypothetical protein